MKNIYLLYLLFISFFSYSQGSGNELNFDGTDDYINGNNATLSTYTNNFTMEMWVNPTATITIKPQQNGLGDISGTTGNGQRYAVGPTWGSNFCGSANNAGTGISVGTNGIQVYEHKGCYMPALLVYNAALPAGWNHIAVVYIAKQPRLYLNGVLVATGLTSLQTNVFPSASIGGYVYGYYQGKIDEFRIWNSSRTQTQIRDNMCKKLIGTEANLVRYYRFDHTSGTATAVDVTGNQNGALINMNTGICWVTSGAALGDASAYNYPGSWVGQTVNLLSIAKGDFEVNTVAGNPFGIHIYRVDAVPNSTIGLTGLGNNNTYFGTYVAGGTVPTYTAVFDYSLYPDALFDENNLILNTRGNNSITIWANISATLNTGTNTLTKTGIANRGEFILSNPTTPLPIELLSFEAKVKNERVNLKWITASEINNDYFTVERYIEGSEWKDFVRVEGAGNSSEIKNYEIFDSNPPCGLLYYRLKQTDYNGDFKYSEVMAVKFECGITVNTYPNPTTGIVVIEFTGEENEINYIEVIPLTGSKIRVEPRSSGNNKFSIDLSGLSNGIYFLKIETPTQSILEKVNILK